MYFLGQNAHKLIFYLFFSIFTNFYKIWPNFLASLLFFQFFSIDNNLSCLLYFRLSSIYNFYAIYCLNMHIILIFYQFWQISALFWDIPIFLINFFQLIITYHVFFIVDYHHVIIFYVFFLVKMHIIPIFFTNFS